MYVDASTVRTPTGKSYTRYLLRKSYRKQGKVKHDTIANLSSCSLAEIEAIRLALRHKQDLTALVSLKDDLRLEQGLSVGAVWTMFSVAKRLGIVVALGSTRAGKLALVEWAFRTSKTVNLEVRPVHVRTEAHTRGHVFVVMLSYLIIAELARCWQDLDVTVNEGISQLDTLCATQFLVKGQVRCNQIPQPRPLLQQLLKAAKITLPEVLPSRGVTVTTRKKLTSRRKKR